MSLASQISDLATAIGAKIKIAAPITKHKVEVFGLVPLVSTAVQTLVNSATYYFNTLTFGSDGATISSSSTWALSGHWSGTYTLVLYHGKLSNGGICKVEISKNGGSTWTSLTTTLDMYAAASAPGVQTFTAIAIPEGSDVQLKFTITGRNASNTTGYFYAISGWELARTGA